MKYSWFSVPNTINKYDRALITAHPGVTPQRTSWYTDTIRWRLLVLLMTLLSAFLWLIPQMLEIILLLLAIFVETNLVSLVGWILLKWGQKFNFWTLRYYQHLRWATPSSVWNNTGNLGSIDVRFLSLNSLRQFEWFISRIWISLPQRLLFSAPGKSHRHSERKKKFLTGLSFRFKFSWPNLASVKRINVLLLTMSKICFLGLPSWRSLFLKCVWKMYWLHSRAKYALPRIRRRHRKMAHRRRWTWRLARGILLARQLASQEIILNFYSKFFHQNFSKNYSTIYYYIVWYKNGTIYDHFDYKYQFCAFISTFPYILMH